MLSFRCFDNGSPMLSTGAEANLEMIPLRVEDGNREPCLGLSLKQQHSFGPVATIALYIGSNYVHGVLRCIRTRVCLS
jgi:hypothetical protein